MNQLSSPYMAKEIYSEEQDRIIGKIIQARKEEGITQLQLAKKLGFTQSYISKIEAGQVSISVVLLKNTAKVLNKGIEYFI